MDQGKPRLRDHIHPLIKSAIHSARVKSGKDFTFLGICNELKGGRDWLISELEFVKSMTAQGFESEIKAATGSDFQQLLQEGLKMVKSASMPKSQFGDAPIEFFKACQTIVNQKPESRMARIIQREIDAAGLEGPITSESKAEHGVDFV